MTDDDRTELTPAEQAAFAALPTERDATAFLEERTVKALRHRGLVRGEKMHRPIRRLYLWTFGLAASVALFACGLATGQWLGTRAVVGSLVAAEQQSAMQTAALVQQTGSAYVTALMALAQLADSSSEPAFQQGREVALTALHAAARELAVLAPEDPLAVILRDALSRSMLGDPASGQPVLQSVVWF